MNPSWQKSIILYPCTKYGKIATLFWQKELPQQHCYALCCPSLQFPHCSILFCLIKLCSTIFCLNIYGSTTSCPILHFSTLLFYPIQPYPRRSFLILFYPVPRSSASSSMSVVYYPAVSYTVHTMHPTLFHPTLSHPAQFYPIFCCPIVFSITNAINAIIWTVFGQSTRRQVPIGEYGTS